MYYTEREVRELLEQAFAEGYDDGIDDTLDYIDENYELESDDFDLMDEYDSYTESSKNVRDQMDNLMASTDYMRGGHTTYYPKNPKRDWTKFADKRNAKTMSNGVGTFNVKFKGDEKYHARNGYLVKNTSDKPLGITGYARGRIKSGANDSDDPRSEKLKNAIKRNAAKQKEKFKPFKNKGNEY